MNQYHLYIANNNLPTNYLSCRESLIYYYRQNINHTRKEYRPNKVIYFGHTGDVPQKVIDNYLPSCNIIWKDKVEYSLVELKDIEDCSQVLRNDGYRKNNEILIKVKGAVNPLDISAILKLSWFGQTMGTNAFAKYVCTKMYSNLIPNEYTLYRNIYMIINGPERMIDSLRYYRSSEKIKLYRDIESLYYEHHSEFTI